MPVNEKAFLIIEEAYTKYIMGKYNHAQLCKDISVSLGSLPFESGKKTFNVQISNKDGRDRFFGMRVFPEVGNLDEFCKNLIREGTKFNDLVKRWKVIKDWTLEIDAIVFDRNRINFTPKEFVALILHEIGHVIYSDKPVEGFYRAYREAKLRMSVTDKLTEKIMYQIYMLPLAVACTQRRWSNGREFINNEIVADKTVLELGYGEHLIDAFSKIIKYFGDITENKDRQQDEINSVVEWCTKNISDIMKRKETLKDELYYQGIKNNSSYIKALTIIMLDKLGMKMREKYTGAVVENTIELLSDPNVLEKYTPVIDIKASVAFEKAYMLAISPAMEAASYNKRKKTKIVLPSQYEIDAIGVEVDKITNHHDRIFVLDMIYEVLDKINTFEEAIALEPPLQKKWAGVIVQMKKELESYRLAVLAKKNFGQKYKFFVQYPEGYEG